MKLCVNGLFRSVCYRVGEAVVDPGDEWAGFVGVRCVLLTHAHFDHIYGLERVLELNPEARVFTNEEGRRMLADARRNLSFYHGTPLVFSRLDAVYVVEDGEEVPLGCGLTARAVFTPGHSGSCVTWLTDGCIFTGDSYIPGVKVVTNLPGGDRRAAAASLERILALAEGRTVWPGHSTDAP